MKNIYIILVILFLFPHFTKGQALPQQQVFTSSNEADVTIMGLERNYVLRSNRMAGRFDDGQRLFEFILPIQTILPVTDSSHLEVFNDLFLRNYANTNIHITAAFQDPLINVEDFKSPREFILDGWLTMHGVQYNVPVFMSLYYSNDMLYYKMRVDLDLYQLNWHIPPHYRNFLTGIVQIQINDGRWSNYLTQAR